jgi:predicted AAA+ superfamily ATPase
VDPEIVEFARSYRRLADEVHRIAPPEGDELSEVGRHVQSFLGVPLTEVEPVSETFPPHQVVDLDLALESLLTEYAGVRRGIGGSHRMHVDGMLEFLNSGMRFSLGPVAYERRSTGPDSDRRVVAFGLGELRIDGVPLVWLQRAASPQYGRERYTVELLCPDRDVTDRFVARVRERMSELSVMRGQVVSFTADEFSYHAAGAGMTFLRRPEVTAAEVILPEGVRERVVRHVVGIGEHREVLRQAGQHLKRGVLLYGPPGTGKTHLVRHLLGQTAGTTAVLLSGRTLGLLNDATALARSAQPAIVVLEDCDLIAEHRGGDTNAALFETLEAMDGLAADADITFILTTNRADLLERALVERPGRVDLAVEIAKPDQEGRERLFRLYAADLIAAGQLSEAAVHTAAARTEGVTASFTKELIRRCVLNAALAGRPPEDADVSHALDEMLSDAEALTRTLLGGEGGYFPEPDDAGPPDWPRSYGPQPGIDPHGMGWSSYEG